jgi:hypothetical protein
MSKHRFPAVFGPFSTVFRASGSGGNVGFAALLPFSLARAPLKNGENGENGKGSRPSKPCPFFGVRPI